MESNSSKSMSLKGVDSSLDIPPNSKVVDKVLLTSEPNSAEDRQATKTMLEDVCTDFESMDVFSSKNNKIGVIKNTKSNKLQQCSVDKNKNSTMKKDTLINKTVVNEEVGVKDKLLPVNEVHHMDVIHSGEIDLQPVEVPAASEKQILDDISDATVITSDSVVYTQSELLPLSNCETPSNVTILTESAGENIAQLADAEIVQTDGNVSIIVTNTRLIKVLTNADSSISSIQGATAAVIDPTAAVLESDLGVTQQINIVNPSLLSNNVFQSLAIADDSTMVQETVISEKESPLPRTGYKPTDWGSSRGVKRPYRATFTSSTPTSKARRVTAKMKSEWSRQLEKDGHLSCQMPGCSQTYVTVANFQTHYKYCTGKKRLQHCLYCDSLIFSTHKAILHHMEVEHPDKVQEYKATYPEEETELEGSSLTPHLLVSEDDNVAMNVEEVTQHSTKKKRKLSSKENVVLPKKAVLKHKIQSIQSSMAENAKEFKKCVRFDNIIDKINSVDDPSNFEAAYPSDCEAAYPSDCEVAYPSDCEVAYPDDFEVASSKNKPKLKGKMKRVILTESIVEKKYFEDDDDEDVDSPRNFVYPNDIEGHTKARMMLNMERYKRYKEYLILTRDWSSARKTYSRKRDSDMSLDSSFLMQSQNESVEDVHQLNDTVESSSISLNTSETEINPLEMSSLQTDLVEKIVEEPPVTTTDKTDKPPSILFKELPFKDPVVSVDKCNISDSRTRKEKTCYGRASLEAAKSKPAKYQGIITYGLNVPGTANKHVTQPLSFDSLVDFLKPKPVESQTSTDVDAATNEEILKPTDEDCIKHPDVKIEKPDVPKRKRGRPPKLKPDAPSNLKKTKNKVDNSNKYSTAMLKSIEKNVNRKIKLFGVKKNSKLKSQKFVSRLQSKMSTLKNNKMKQSKRKQMAKNIIRKKKAIKSKSIDESAIQCEENIDNRLPLGNESDNILHLQCLSADRTYMPADVVGNQKMVNANSIAEAHTSNADATFQPVTGLCYDSVPIQTTISEAPKPLSTNMLSANTEGTYNTIVNEPCTLKNDFVESNVEIPPLNHDSTENNAEIPPLNHDSTESNDKILPPNHDSTESDAKIPPLNYDSTESNPAIPPPEQVIANVENDIDTNNQESDCKEQENVSVEHNLIVDFRDTVPEKTTESILQDKQTGKDSSECEAPEISSNKSPHSSLDKYEIVEQSGSTLIHDGVLSQEAKPSSVQGECLAENLEGKLSEVPVKRRRGRPRKNVTLLSELCSLDSPIQGVSNNNKLEKSIDNQTDIESPVADNGMQTPTLRKSERVKRRKIANEETIHSKIIENTTPKEKTTPKVTTPGSGVRKGRGRPRKYPPTELAADLLEVKTAEPTENHSEVEPESVTESLRKYSRKGRPRKCVRYVDLNAGLDSSESLDGLVSGKDKLESAKMKGKSVKKSITESHDSSYDQEGKIILPLKKRKQRQTRKDDLKLDKADTSKENSELLLSDEENEDVDDDNREDRKLNISRNLRGNRKGVKRKRKEIDSSDEEWELPDHFKGEFRSKNSSQTAHRKSSTREIIEMEEESSSSSCSETNDRRAGPKKGSRKLSDTALIRRYAAKSISRVKELDSATLKESLQITKIIFPDQKPQRCMWKPMSGKDYYATLPPLKTSAYFKTENLLNDKEAFWNSLSFFDSAPLDKESCHSTFFTGGPVLCSAWCPTPADNAKVQYVALATSCYMNKLNRYVSTNGERGLLQLWNVGVLSNKVLESKPFMELSISHQYNPIADMAWCPVGCWEDPSAECLNDKLPRLGMLGLACIDGNVRIYSIPHPQFLPKEETCFPIYSACPSITLEPMFGGICGVTTKSMCTSLSWQSSDDCQRLAAGYGNGMICIWRINTFATILAVKENNQTIISPYLVFNAHGTPVLSVSFSTLPGARYLVSSSIDKTLKFWDLIDTSLPFFSVKKGSGKCAEWANHYCGVIATLDYGMDCFRGATFFRECGTETLSTRVVSSRCCSVTKISMSKWLNAHAIADISGAVTVSFVHNLVQDHSKTPQYFHRPAYLSELKLVDGMVEKVAFSSYPESVDCIGAIQEMTDVASSLNHLVEMCCKEEPLDLNSLNNSDIQESLEFPTLTQINPEESGCANCLSAVEEIKDIISSVHEVTKSCEDTVSVNCDENAQVLQSDSSSKTLLEKPEDSSRKEPYRDAERNERCTITSNVPNKVSEIADIVTLVADMNAVTNTLDHLMQEYQNSSASQSVNEDALVEVDDDPPVLDGGKQPAVSDLSLKANLKNRETESCVLETVCDLENKTTAGDKIKSLQEKYERSKLTNENNCLVRGTGLPFDLSEMMDVVGTVTEVKDTVAAIGNMTGIIASVTTLKDVVSSVAVLKDVVSSVAGLKDVVSSVAGLNDVVSSVAGLKNVVGSVMTLKDVVASTTILKDIVSSVADLKEVTVVIEKLKNETQKICSLENSLDNLNSVVMKDNPLLETFVILSNIVKQVSKEIDDEQVIKNVMCEIVSNVEKLNKSDEWKSQKLFSSRTSSHNAEVASNTTVAGKRNLTHFGIPNKIITVLPSTKFSTKDNNAVECNSGMLHTQNFNYKLSELSDKLEASMLLADEESSNSENDIYSDDDLQMDVSCTFDQESNFSEVSVLSECSLDSNISMCTSSGESDISETSSVGEQENENSISDTANAKNVSEDIPLPSLLSILSEGLSVKLPTMNTESSASSPQNLKLEGETSITGSVDVHNPAKISDEVELIEVMSSTTDSIVPESQENSAPLESNLEFVSVKPKKIDNIENFKDLNCQSSERFMEIVETENVLSGGFDDATSDKTQCHLNTHVSLPVDESCDKNVCGTSIDVSNEPCTESVVKNNIDCTDNTNSGNNLQEASDSNCVPHDKPVILSDIHETPICNKQLMNNEECRNSSMGRNSIVNDKNSLFSKRFSSYEDVVSQYGIVFKDMNTANFGSIENSVLDVSEASSLDQYLINSIKTVAWNPNFGSHFWLFSAGQSGIARLSYVSDINEPSVSEQQNSNDA